MEERHRLAVTAIKYRFLSWRNPPVELPAESVIEQAVKDVEALLGPKIMADFCAELAKEMNNAALATVAYCIRTVPDYKLSWKDLAEAIRVCEERVHEPKNDEAKWRYPEK